MPNIVIVGSINMDLVVRCAHLRATGERITAHSAAEIPGGKGANQAVAASRAGGNVTMIGRVGDDAFAGRFVKNPVRLADGASLFAATRFACAAGAIAAIRLGAQPEMPMRHEIEAL